MTGAHHVKAFQAALAEHLGLCVASDGHVDVEALLRTRVAATESREVSAYIGRVLPTQGELATLARELTIGETYFFRNRDHFVAFAALAREHAARGAPISVLSAGCASGEEPYSLAITLRELAREGVTLASSIVGFDANPDAIAKAVAGRYSRWSLRDTPDDLRQRYFVKSGDLHQLAAEVKSMVQVEQKNLVAPGVAWRAASFDVIFCRNLLMYFAPEAVSLAIARLVDALVPGGWLFLGHAETMRGLLRETPDVDFELELTPLGAAFAYRRRGASRSAFLVDTRPREASPRSHHELLAPSGDWQGAIERASERVEALVSRTSAPPDATIAAQISTSIDLARVRELVARERFQEALAMLPADVSSAPSQVRLLYAALLVHTGDFAAAEATCASITRDDGLEAGAFYLTGLCREYVGDVAGAIEQHQRAAYLDAGFAMPHLHLGLLERRRGDRSAARRELGVARDLFEREDGARLELFAGGFGRDALVAMCEGELGVRGGLR